MVCVCCVKRVYLLMFVVEHACIPYHTATMRCLMCVMVDIHMLYILQDPAAAHTIAIGTTLYLYLMIITWTLAP